MNLYSLKKLRMCAKKPVIEPKKPEFTWTFGVELDVEDEKLLLWLGNVPLANGDVPDGRLYVSLALNGRVLDPDFPPFG